MADESETKTPTPATETPPAGESPPTPAAPTPTPVEDVDPDQAELDAALKEVDAEDKAKAATPPAETPPAETPPAETPPAPETTTVPVAALQEERRKRQEAEEAYRKSVSTALYYKGVADGRLPVPQREDEPPAPKTDRIKEIRAAQRELGKQVDAGTLSTEEYEVQRQALDDEILGIREQRLLDEVKQSLPQGGHDLFLEEKTDALETANPWVKKIPQDEIELLIPFARKELKASGFDLTSVAGTPIGDFKLREALVKVAQRQGFDKMYGGEAAAAPAGTPATPTARPTAEQIAAKAALAAGAPPTPVGTTAPATTWNAERVETMDSLDLENMPMADLKRIGEAMDREAATARVHTTMPRR